MFANGRWMAVLAVVLLLGGWTFCYTPCCGDGGSFLDGRVFTREGAPIGGATVTLFGRETTTDSAGCFHVFTLHSPRARRSETTVRSPGMKSWRGRVYATGDLVAEARLVDTASIGESSGLLRRRVPGDSAIGCAALK